MVISEPKTSKSRRQIALTDLAREALTKHRLCQREARLVAGGERWIDQGWAFTNLRGALVEPTQLRDKFFPSVLKKAELPRMRFHDLRHTAATLLLVMGVHPKIVQETLGHSSISITLDTYSHVIPTLQSEAVGRLNTLLAAQ